MNNSFILNTINTLLNLIDVLCVILPVLLSVAFMTIIERKQLAAHQRRVGPNTTGYFGILQPFIRLKRSGIYLFISNIIFLVQINYPYLAERT